MSPLFWVEAYKYAEFLYNRMTTASTGEFTSHELVYGKRPRFDRVKVFGCDIFEHLDGLPKVPGGVKARKGFFLGIPEDAPSGYLMFDINAGMVRTVFSASFDESFVRRSCGIRVYDQARAIDSAKRRGKAMGKDQPVVSELFFSEPDDPLVMGVARAMLDSDDRWNKRQAPDVKTRGEETSDVAPRGEKSSGEPRKMPDLGAKQKSEAAAGGTSAVDVNNLPKGDEAVGLRVAKDFTQGVFLGTVTKYLPPTAPDEWPLWQIVYDDGDEEQYDESNLKEGVSLF